MKKFMMVLVAAVGVMVFAKSSNAAEPSSPKWFQVTSPNGFEVQLPGEPKITRKEVPTDDGPLSTETEVQVLYEKTAYRVSTKHIEGLSKDNKATLLREAGQHFISSAEKLQAKVLLSRQISLSNVSGLESRLELPDGTIRHFRFFIVGDRMHMLRVTGPAAEVALPATVRFLDSFTLKEVGPVKK